MKLALVGNGKIVRGALTALPYVPKIKVTAICCRPQSKDKADALANEFGIPQVFTDYDQLLKEKDIDFVYIGISNHVHYEYGRKALEAGKNVIMEKPMCLKYEEVEALAALAFKKELYLFEAVTFLHAPFFEKIRWAAKQLGPIKLVQGNYSKYSSRYERYLKHDVAPVFDPEQGGGALYDLNIYNLNYVVALFGRPKDLIYCSNLGYNGVDTSGTALLKYPDFMATLSAAKDSQSPCFFIVQGEKGWLSIMGSPDKLKKMTLSLGDKVSEVDLQRPHHRMVDEFKDFEKIWRTKDYAGMTYYVQLSMDVAHCAERAMESK